MKKFGFCLLALCLMGYVTGCGNEDTAPTDNTPADTTPAEPAPPADTTGGGEGDAPA